MCGNLPCQGVIQKLRLLISGYLKPFKLLIDVFIALVLLLVNIICSCWLVRYLKRAKASKIMICFSVSLIQIGIYCVSFRVGYWGLFVAGSHNIDYVFGFVFHGLNHYVSHAI